MNEFKAIQIKIYDLTGAGLLLRSVVLLSVADKQKELIPALFGIPKNELCILKLHLNYLDVDVKDVRVLPQNQAWENLQSLRLSSCKIDSKGALELAANKTWNNLKELGLASNKIGNEGAIALAANTTWPKLNNLDLSSNNIGSEGTVA